ncbi:hypothetical protein P7K49_000766 [Saguinus oedipus]|uniref:UBA domain-containing protein n=1 Tax=Saguinus oedipus TaxID=9490 RepID=A0ABQ9WD30_SAGOE|nr:hypothetical protein P7K49_000766 [Saguinus oedipus]
MMMSVGTNRTRANWEQTQNQNQTAQAAATAKQTRLAQMISDHNDADFEEKVKRLMDIMGKNQDECVISLQDCNGDVNRAINVLLEGNPDTNSWEMVRKKKGVSGQKNGGQMAYNKEGKENRDRDRDYISGVQQFKADSISQPASGNTFSYHSMVSMLGKAFGDVGEAKGGSTTGSQFLEKFKTAQALAQLAAQHSQTGSTTTSSWNMGSTTQSPSLVQYDLKNLSDSTMSPGSSDNQSSSPQPAQQKLKQQKKKASSTSKIPVLAVEMPGSADISGLNLQFGALQFGSEPVLSDYESTPTKSTSSSQALSSPYTSTTSESSSTF